MNTSDIRTMYWINGNTLTTKSYKTHRMSKLVGVGGLELVIVVRSGN